MLNKKISKEELEELRKVVETENQYAITTQFWRFRKESFIKNILPKYGFNESEIQNISIDLRTGKIKKVEQQKITK